jgi:signal transduction histidine kinase
MFKSVFTRLFVIYLIITLLSLLSLGAMVSQMLRSQYLDNEISQMRSDMNTVIEIAQRYLNGEISYYAFANQISIKANRDNNIICVLDSNGQSWLLADPLGKDFLNNEPVQKQLKAAFNQIKTGNAVQSVSTLENLYQTQAITMGVPIFSGDEVTGAIFIYSELKELDNSLGVIYRQLVNAAIISMLMALILVYLFSRYMVKDLRKINTAAKSLSKGDFTTRVQLKNQNEIGQLADTFNNMAEELQKLEGLRISFVANVSHELRTPLTSIQGFVQGILDGAIAKEDQDTYLSTVLDETKRLNLLISDLLELSKIESGKFPLNNRIFDINELMRRCLITFEQRIENKKLNVQVIMEDERLYANADPDRIAQVITNLIDNAVKFSSQEGGLVLRTQVHDDKIYVSVKDTGEGIPDKDLPFIFERFYKVDKSRGRKLQGTGIGLSIVKKIMDQHGQKIWVESKLNEGSVFTFSLKLEK